MTTDALWHTRPVFISPTFRDMQAERDWLRTHVFPRLEEKLRKRRHHLEPIDLRIGVETAQADTEEARELLVLKVCLDEIKRSRPFLLVLLGDRYGWVPPEDRIAAAAREQAFETVPDLRGLHAVVLDDNRTAREILSTYLHSFSFEVDEASTPDELFQLIRESERPYDLVVLDWLMPQMEGLEVARVIKTDIRPAIDPHIVMVSGFSSGDMKERPGGEFIDQFLTKPVSPSHLFDAVMAAFGVATERESRSRSGGREIDMQALRPVQGAKLLVVEDNEINQQVASELLGQAGFFVDIANHGQEALDKLDARPYDCVLMDVHMPVMDGYTATRKIRENPHFTELPVFAMTANATVEDHVRSLEHGMNDHIVKPINPKILFKALLKWIPHGDRELPVEMRTTEAASEPLEAPSIPGIDTESGLARMGGNVDSYIRLLEKFSANQADCIDEIRAAVASGDGGEAVRLAHTLKGVSGSIGADVLHQAAKELEAALKADASTLPDILIARTGEELDRIIGLISKSVRRSEVEVEGTEQIPEDIVSRLNQLMEKLEQYDAEAEDIISGILPLARGSRIHPELMEIGKLINQYDLEGAAEMLGPFIARVEEMLSAGKP